MIGIFEAVPDDLRAKDEVVTAVGTVRIVRRTWSEPIDNSGRPEHHWLELSMLPRSAAASACFADRWGPHRFEPIGELLLLPAGELVRTRSECRHQFSTVCAFRPAALAPLFGQVRWTDEQLRGCLNIVNPTIRALMFRLGEELRHPRLAGRNLIELIAGQIAIELARHCSEVDGGQVSGGLAPWRLRLIDEALADVRRAPSIDELADICDLSVRQVTRAFRASRGQSIGSYIAQHRIDQAKELLVVDTPVKEIAHVLGFANASNFSSSFRRVTGETPRQYRQRASDGRAKAAGALGG